MSDFQSAVERQAIELIAAAEERAAERERDATKAARRIELDAERSAERILQAALERAAGVLEGIDALEGELTGTMDALRMHTERLAQDLTAEVSKARPQLSAGEAPMGDVPSPSPDGTELPPEFRGDALEASLMTHPVQLRHVLRATVHKMRDEGRAREEAERFLVRFNLAQAHGDLVEEIYGGPETTGTGRRRRGGWLRGRPG